MRRRSGRSAVVFAVALAIAVAGSITTAANAQSSAVQMGKSGAVMQITVLDPHDKGELYLQLVKKTIARQNEVAPGIKTRIFRGTFAGTSTGLFYIVLEYPSMEFMIEAQAKLARDPEWDRLRRDSAVQTGRTLISDSLFADVTP